MAITPINTSDEFYNYYGKKTNGVNFFMHPSRELQTSATKAGAYAQYDLAGEHGYSGTQYSLGGISGQNLNIVA